uniref:Hedgehog/Intein (Hint) domain-containing protein n=1 Tax=viral metagenome TaxID=1070528 RepID=A0A6C0E2X3_9ZZZZ
MPSGKNWINFIYVNLGFIAQVLVMYYFTALIEIKKNWPEYRCNPLYMPLSDNISADFTYCVQSTQINLMGYLLQPITYLISSMNSIGGEFTTSINSVRGFISVLRDFITSIVENIYNVFLNLIIQFQVIMIGIKDMIGKVIGIMVALMYMMDGSIKTMESAWNGPAGQMVQSLSCFDPDTKIRLKNGSVYSMKDIPLDAVLENGSKVFAVMKITNSGEDLYKIKEGGVNNEDIYVTGSHYMYDVDTNRFVQVHNCKLATKVTNIIPWYSCLITTDNKIKIGKHLFWDWEDDCLSK